MPRRHKDFNELLAKQFKDEAFCTAYIKELINDEKLSIEDALKRAIVAMGIKEFSIKAGVSIAHISSFINGTRKVSKDTQLDYLASVYGLKVTHYHVEEIQEDAA